MPGELDANGVYIYSEDDALSPFSDFLNMGQYSISDALGALGSSTDARLDALEQGVWGSTRATVYQASATWTKPAHLLGIRVRAFGAGGAGGGAVLTSASQMSAGGGGGAGAVSEAWFPASALPSTVAVTVGTGGTGVSGGAGNAGGASSFGAYLTAPGGSGGGVTAAATATAGAPSGAGGVAGTATGQTGDALLVPGGTADRTNIFPTASVWQSGNAGSNSIGNGALGPGSNSNGNAGSVGGGGGGGTVNGVSQAARTGGAGGNGLVIIEQFYKVV